MIRPLRDLVVLRRREAPAIVGLIHVPEDARAEMHERWEAEVVAVGPGLWQNGRGGSDPRRRCPMPDVAVGDRVQVAPAGTKEYRDAYTDTRDWEEDGVRYWILRAGVLMGVIEQGTVTT